VVLDEKRGLRLKPAAAAMVLFSVLVVGCATFGSRAGLPSHARSIAIPVFRNKTLEYGAEEDVTRAVRHEFLRDGRLQVTRRDEADLVLEGTIVEYEIIPAGFERDERATSSNVRATVNVSLLDRVTGETLLTEVPFKTSGTFFETAEPTRRRKDDVFIRLADDIVSRVIEGW
jgi:hypothetical protein